jgi:hypothetical protein
VSHLNITQAKTKYGGTYECRASSKVGSVAHVGKLNVLGAPFVQRMRPAKVVAGKSMAVTCPVAGYPISSIAWEDAATYTCVARNDEGYSARSDLAVTVMGKKCCLQTQHIIKWLLTFLLYLLLIEIPSNFEK